MKSSFFRLVLAGLIAGAGVSCTTAYDASGRPVRVADPAKAPAVTSAYGLAWGGHDYDYYRRGYGYPYDSGRGRYAGHAYYRPGAFYPHGYYWPHDPRYPH